MKHLLIAITLSAVFLTTANGQTCDFKAAKTANIELRYDDALKGFAACHEQGDIEATTMLGMTYITEYYGNANYEKGKQLFEQAIAKGDAKANLGMAYYYQFNAQYPDKELAYEYFEAALAPLTKAAEEGDIYWTSRLAYLYSNGYGTEMDEQKSIELLRSILPSNYPIAQHNLAYAFMKGEYVFMDYDSAYLYYRLALNGGFKPSCAGLYDIGLYSFYGIDTEINLLQAEKWLKEASACGSEGAASLLALTYFNLGKENEAIDLALTTYKTKLAEGYYLAYYYLNAREKDFKKAENLLTKLASAKLNDYVTEAYLFSLLYGNPNQTIYYNTTKSWNYLEAAHEADFNFYFGPEHTVNVGDKIPELFLPDTTGTNIALSNFNGKYLLVDFWASWCGPCRVESPNLVAMYNKYKDQGFDILSVSLDVNKARWKKAIDKDGLNWRHMSDLGGWESIANWLYDINSIPASFLIDKNGIVLGTNLRGSRLGNKLEELLGE